MSQYEDIVKIDECHITLIYGLIVAHKPASILELGYGSGASLNSNLWACTYNQNNPRYVVVDNWLDYGYQKPAFLTKYDDNVKNVKVSFVTADEGDYVRDCNETFDFILSDADHQRTDQWFERVYDELLADNGILIYHDVTNKVFPNLDSILQKCEREHLRYMLFNKNSIPGERCDRGLLVISKRHGLSVSP